MLAIVSKNDEGLALEAMTRHQMVLRCGISRLADQLEGQGRERGRDAAS
jgi:hypothetical protein